VRTPASIETISAGGEHPRTSRLGIGLSVANTIGTPLLGRAKQRIGQRLAAIARMRAQNMLCAC